MTKTNITAAHKFFLRYFIRPSSIDDVLKRNPNLGSSLGEDPTDVYKMFIADGLLISATLQEKLLTLTVSELQDILDGMGLSAEGIKDEMVIRILSVESNSVIDKVANIELFVCSDKGRRLVDDQIENTSGEAKPFKRFKKIILWLDDRGVTGNVIYEALKYIVTAIVIMIVNNKLALGNWINRIWMKLKESVKKFINFIYDLGRRIQK